MCIEEIKTEREAIMKVSECLTIALRRHAQNLEDIKLHYDTKDYDEEIMITRVLKDTVEYAKHFYKKQEGKI